MHARIRRPARVGAPWHREHRAFTVFEMSVVALVLVTVVGFAGELFFRSTFSEKRLGGKIDALHRARMASLRLAQELRHGVEIFYPPMGLNQTRPMIIFSNEYHELIVIYLNENGELVRLNRHDNDRTEVLAEGIYRVRFFRKGRRLVNYHLHVRDPKADPKDPKVEQIHVISGISLRNNYN